MNNDIIKVIIPATICGIISEALVVLLYAFIISNMWGQNYE